MRRLSFCADEDRKRMGFTGGSLCPFAGIRKRPLNVFLGAFISGAIVLHSDSAVRLQAERRACLWLEY